MRQKKVGFYIVFVIYIIFLIIDIVTTIYLGSVGRVLEANPLYKYIGFSGIIALNLIIGYCFIYLYTTKPFWRFFTMAIMNTVILARCYAIQNAWYAITHPITLEKAIEVSQMVVPIKTAAITEMAIVSYVPLIFCLITYGIWRIDNTCKKKI